MGGYGNSSVGRIRSINEDSFLVENGVVGELSNLYVVADGMGGHLAGEVASKMAVESIKSFLAEFNYCQANLPEDLTDLLIQAVNSANNKVFVNAAVDASHNGMGTTLLAATVFEGTVYMVNVGDSRLYVVNKSENSIKQITIDHSYVMELVRKGEITREEAEYHPNKNIITRALGTGVNVKADTFVYEMKEGDMLLLCSDGLSNMLSEDEILQGCAKYDDIAQMVESLLIEANKKGGLDNITVIIYSSGEGDK